MNPYIEELIKQTFTLMTQIQMSYSQEISNVVATKIRNCTVRGAKEKTRLKTQLSNMLRMLDKVNKQASAGKLKQCLEYVDEFYCDFQSFERTFRPADSLNIDPERPWVGQAKLSWQNLTLAVDAYKKQALKLIFRSFETT